MIVYKTTVVTIAQKISREYYIICEHTDSGGAKKKNFFFQNLSDDIHFIQKNFFYNLQILPSGYAKKTFFAPP